MWFVDQIESSHRLRAVSAVGVRFPLHDTANGIAGRIAGGQVVAISVPAPTDRFNTGRDRIVAALREASTSAVWR